MRTRKREIDGFGKSMNDDNVSNVSNARRIASLRNACIAYNGAKMTIIVTLLPEQPAIQDPIRPAKVHYLVPSGTWNGPVSLDRGALMVSVRGRVGLMRMGVIVMISGGFRVVGLRVGGRIGVRKIRRVRRRIKVRKGVIRRSRRSRFDELYWKANGEVVQGWIMYSE